MLVAEWMTRDPVALHADDTMFAAADLMNRRKIRRVPVVEGGRLVGIVTKGDLLAASPSDLNPFSPAADGSPALARPLREVMTGSPVTVRADAPIEAAARLMVERKIAGVPVVRDDGTLAGIITESDLFRAFAQALGADEPGLRITFDVSRAEDAGGFAVDLARRYGLRVGSLATFARGTGRTAVVRLVGPEPPGLIDEIWKTGHRVVSVLRTSRTT
jgi:acetoin utilization protein AcuB